MLVPGCVAAGEAELRPSWALRKPTSLRPSTEPDVLLTNALGFRLFLRLTQWSLPTVFHSQKCAKLRMQHQERPQLCFLHPFGGDLEAGGRSLAQVASRGPPRPA